MSGAREEFNRFMKSTRPKDALDGLSRGLKTAGTGLVAGVGNAVACTVSGVQQGTPQGVVKGVGLGVVGAAVFTVGGACCGMAQIGRGIVNTPEGLRGRREQRVWDAELGEWVDIDLVALEMEVDAENSDEEADGEDGVTDVADTEYYDLLRIRPNA